MADDKNNINRLDLPEIIEEAQRLTEYKYRGLGKAIKENFDHEGFILTPQENKQVLKWILEGTAEIASTSSFAQNSNQTGLDALTYSLIDDDEDVLHPDYYDKGMKLEGNDGMEILFEIPGVVPEQRRYTIVQQFIRTAILNYILFQWYKTIGLYEDSNVHFMEYEKFKGKVSYNGVVTRPTTRPYTTPY